MTANIIHLIVVWQTRTRVHRSRKWIRGLVSLLNNQHNLCLHNIGDTSCSTSRFGGPSPPGCMVFVGGKPGNFPITGSDLHSHWFVWKLRGNGKAEGRERGKGRVGETTPALLPPLASASNTTLVPSCPPSLRRCLCGSGLKPDAHTRVITATKI